MKKDKLEKEASINDVSFFLNLKHTVVREGFRYISSKINNKLLSFLQYGHVMSFYLFGRS